MSDDDLRAVVCFYDIYVNVIHTDNANVYPGDTHIRVSFRIMCVNFKLDEIFLFIFK